MFWIRSTSVFSNKAYLIWSEDAFSISTCLLLNETMSSDLTYCVPELCTSFFASFASKLASSEEEISRNFTSFLLSELLWVGVCLLLDVVDSGLKLEQLTKKVVTANAAKIN